MSIFTTKRERRIWILTAMVVLTIFLPLIVGQPLAEHLRDQNVQAIFFVSGMLLAGISVFLSGIRNPGKMEWAVLIGLAAIYVMFYFRLGAPERSHLIEYSVLAVFIHQALSERSGEISKIRTAFMAFAMAFVVGFLDEFIQLFIPDRVFDWVDVFFNGMVIAIALLASLVLSWIRARLSNRS